MTFLLSSHDGLAGAMLAAVAAPQPQLWHWIVFGALVLVLLAIDLSVFHRQDRVPSLRGAALATIVWLLLALCFNAVIGWLFGYQAGVEFLTGYMIEWSLSMDNVFVFAVIFKFFQVPMKYQYRVLYWGILGAVLMRLSFILMGTVVLKHFEWAMPLFGLFLIYTSFRLSFSESGETHPDKNILLRIARRLFPVAKEDHGHNFFARENGHLCLTPLFIVLLVVESTDVAFAVDSVPAIFGVTRDPFIVFTSNIFAILGLRALYFLLAGVMDLFRYLNYGLNAVLCFIGVKMVAAYFWPHQIESIPHANLVSLAVIGVLLGTAVVASLVAKWREDRQASLPDANNSTNSENTLP